MTGCPPDPPDQTSRLPPPPVLCVIGVMKHMRKAAWIVAGGSTILLGGCAAYSGVVAARWRAWERGVERHPDGVRVGCEPFSVGQGRTAILFVHGFGDNPSTWRPMAEKFAAHGFHCRAMRLPGFGGTMDERKAVTLETWTRAVADEALALRRAHDEVWIVAHSLGAAVSVRHVLDGGNEVTGLALLAPLVKVSGKRSPLLSARTWFQVLGRWTPLAESMFPEDVRKDLPPGRPDVERFIPVNIYVALFRLLDENENQAGDLRVPLYGAVSPHDKVADWRAAEAWLNRTSQVPRRRLVRANDSAHLIPIDFDAGWIGDEIEEFVKGPENVSEFL